MVLTGPPNHCYNNTQANAEPICEASCQYSPPNPPESMGASLTNFLAGEARAFNIRFAEAEHIISGYINLLAATTDKQLRRAVEKNGEALQAIITNILRGNPQPQSSGPSEAASSSKTTTLSASATRPEGKKSASTSRPVQILTRESSQAKGKEPASTKPTRPIDIDSIQTPIVTEGSWTQVVRKKTKPAPPEATKSQPASEPKSKATGPTQTPRPTASAPKLAHPDERVFLRVKPDHPWRRMSPHYIKMSLASKLRLANSAIKQVTIVLENRYGFDE